MKQNGVVCKPGPALLFFIFRFEYLISSPKSYRYFRETGLWSLRYVSSLSPHSVLLYLVSASVLTRYQPLTCDHIIKRILIKTEKEIERDGKIILDSINQ